MKNKSGFTIPEVVVVVIFLIIAGVFFTIQKTDLEASKRDNERKTAINAIYYSLENVFYKNNGCYPEKISEKNIDTIDPNLFTDKSGINLGEAGSEYSYEAKGCQEGKCKGYTLKSNLEKEDPYVKNNQ